MKLTLTTLLFWWTFMIHYAVMFTFILHFSLQHSSCYSKRKVTHITKTIIVNCVAALFIVAIVSFAFKTVFHNHVARYICMYILQGATYEITSCSKYDQLNMFISYRIATQHKTLVVEDWQFIINPPKFYPLTIYDPN